MAVGVDRKVGLWKRAVGVGVSRRAWVAEMAVHFWLCLIGGAHQIRFGLEGGLISKAALPVS